MRKIYPVLSVLSLTIIISAFIGMDYARFEWTETTHDFGEIKQNKPVSHEFEFVNKGQSFLVISEVKASCGCTASEYTKEPIPPNGKGKVKATFNAASPGNFHKSITVVANVEGGPEYLYIKGVVIE